MSLGSDLWVLMSVSTRLCADLTDVTLGDEDSNSMPTDDVNRAILGNVAIHMRECNDFFGFYPISGHYQNTYGHNTYVHNTYCRYYE